MWNSIWRITNKYIYDDIYNKVYVIPLLLVLLENIYIYPTSPTSSTRIYILPLLLVLSGIYILPLLLVLPGIYILPLLLVLLGIYILPLPLVLLGIYILPLLIVLLEYITYLSYSFYQVEECSMFQKYLHKYFFSVLTVQETDLVMNHINGLIIIKGHLKTRWQPL